MLEGYTMDQVRVLLDELLFTSFIIFSALAIIIALRYAYIIITEGDKKEDKKNKNG